VFWPALANPTDACPEILVLKATRGITPELKRSFIASCTFFYFINRSLLRATSRAVAVTAAVAFWHFVCYISLVRATSRFCVLHLVPLQWLRQLLSGIRVLHLASACYISLLRPTSCSCVLHLASACYISVPPQCRCSDCGSCFLAFLPGMYHTQTGLLFLCCINAVCVHVLRSFCNTDAVCACAQIKEMLLPVLPLKPPMVTLLKLKHLDLTHLKLTHLKLTHLDLNHLKLTKEARLMERCWGPR